MNKLLGIKQFISRFRSDIVVFTSNEEDLRSGGGLRMNYSTNSFLSGWQEFNDTKRHEDYNRLHLEFIYE